MKLYIAADHVGFALKNELKPYLESEGHEVIDCGNTVFEPEDDYVEFILKAAEAVANDPTALGIIIGKSGNGEQIAANKVKNIRAALCWNEDMARLAKEHNNANIISLGADFVDTEGANAIVRVFINTPFSQEERHIRRVEKISNYESAHH